MVKIGLGGGCHWCTEAVFQSLKGVEKVQQGWINPQEIDLPPSEAVIVHFDPNQISLAVLLEIHLITHSATANHSMRGKYRSAVYAFSTAQAQEVTTLLYQLQAQFERELVTTVYLFGYFKENEAQFLNYYYTNPQKPFCSTYIDPKLKLLMQRFAQEVDEDKVRHLR